MTMTAEWIIVVSVFVFSSRHFYTSWLWT